MLKPAPYAMPVERALFYAGWVFTGLVLLFLIAPILAVIPLSFNAEPYFSYPMPGLSLQWYRDFFGNERWTGALLAERQACRHRHDPFDRARHHGGARSGADAICPGAR